MQSLSFPVEQGASLLFSVEYCDISKQRKCKSTLGRREVTDDKAAGVGREPILQQYWGKVKYFGPGDIHSSGSTAFDTKR